SSDLLNRRSSTFAQHLSRKRYHRSQVQEALNEGDAVVEVVRFRHYTPEAGGRFTGEIHYAFLIITANTGAGPHLILLKNGTDLEGKHLRYYRNAIQYQLEDRNSYHQFLEPLARYLRDAKIRRVFLSPDGVYNQISINSLVNPETGKFIVDEFDIRLVTSSRELVEKGQDKRNDQSSILIGFPTYHLGDAELSRTATAGHLRGTGNRAWRGGLMRYMRGEDGITPLPGTATEVRKIADLVGENAKIYMEGEASERVTKSVRNPGTLHIATHGYFLEDVAP